VTVSGLVTSEREGARPGFLLGGGYEFPILRDIDLNLGASFQRLGSAGAPVTMASVLEATATKRAPTAIFVGAGLGPMFTQGNLRTGARLFAGAELFHLQKIPVHGALELIMMFCPKDSGGCSPGERQTWLAGRVGFRL
jgi:hypothetical protein